MYKKVLMQYEIKHKFWYESKSSRPYRGKGPGSQEVSWIGWPPVCQSGSTWSDARISIPTKFLPLAIFLLPITASLIFLSQLVQEIGARREPWEARQCPGSVKCRAAHAWQNIDLVKASSWKKRKTRKKTEKTSVKIWCAQNYVIWTINSTWYLIG